METGMHAARRFTKAKQARTVLWPPVPKATLKRSSCAFSLSMTSWTRRCARRREKTGRRYGLTLRLRTLGVW